jgi:hypothetical protein
MTGLLLSLFLLALAVPGWGQESKPYVWGDRLPPEALAAAVRVATTDRGAPWAIFAGHSQGLPETTYVDAFLPPTLSTSRLRRGVMQRLECRPAVARGSCSDWQATESLETYVQVADKATFSTGLNVRSASERPITVEGAFSDADLVSLVAFIRSKPQFASPADGTVSYPAGVSGEYPTMWIAAEARGLVSVGMSDDRWVGETATVRRAPKGWILVKVVSWIV